MDILVVPGGRGTRKEMHNEALLAWIEAQNNHTELTTSVCTEAFLLAELGLRITGSPDTRRLATVLTPQFQKPGRL